MDFGVVSTKRNDATGKDHGSNAYNQIRDRSMKDLFDNGEEWKTGVATQTNQRCLGVMCSCF